jgi:hypothetical protein
MRAAYLALRDDERRRLESLDVQRAGRARDTRPEEDGTRPIDRWCAPILRIEGGVLPISTSTA